MKKKMFSKEFKQELKNIVVIVLFFIVITLLIAGAIGLFFQMYESIFLGNSYVSYLVSIVVSLILATILFHETIKKFNIEINRYTLFSMIFIIFIFFSGARVLSDFFPSEIPYSRLSGTNNIYLTCEYGKPFTSFIENRTVVCYIKLPDFLIGKLTDEVKLHYYSKDIPSEDQKINYDGETPWFYIPKITKKDELIGVQLYNTEFNDTRRSDHILLSPNNIYSEEEYNTKELKKITYFVALISLAIFSVLSGVNNFRQINEINKKRKK